MRSVIMQALTAAAGPGLQVRFEPFEAITAEGGYLALQPALLPGAPTPLNPRFTFATYLEADFNRLALTAAQHVAGEPASSYSPLFITGGSGSGKTHLLHAVAHAAAAQGTRLLLANADQFLSEFTTAVRNRSGAAFRARYRDVDLLLIDDVHLLLGKKATLNELYLTIADLHDHGRRAVVAGDLTAVNGEGARFRDQLCWGLVASIEQPSAQDRVRFVHAKASLLGADLPEEIEHYLALRVRSSVRDLEGAVNRVTAIARITREPLTIDFAAKALLPVTTLPAAQPSTTPSEIVDAVCRQLAVAAAAIMSQRRDRDLTYARHITMYLLRQQLGLTYAAIAHMLGKKDHSTVVHACTQIHKELGLSTTLRADIDAIMDRLSRHNDAA
jgi:chromosomal replication initiator protein